MSLINDPAVRSITAGLGIAGLCSLCSLIIRVMRNTDHDGGDTW